MISWSKPFRIARFNYYPTNYSITSAFTFGIDANYLTSSNCGATPVNAYYESTVNKTIHGLRYSTNHDARWSKRDERKATIDKGLKANRSSSRRERLVCENRR